MRIDLFHDTACPWCRIGKVHLNTALAQWDGNPVTVQYHSYFLNPTIPPEGYAFREYMNAKSGGQIPLEQWFAAPREMGNRAGITFNFEAITRAPNTLLSHQLITLAPDPVRETIIDAVYTAYFEQGRDIGDLTELVQIADENGLDSRAIQAQLEAQTAQDQVIADAAQGQRIGVTGVPFFIINQRLAFSGAQPPDVILDVMRQSQTQIEQEAE